MCGSDSNLGIVLGLDGTRGRGETGQAGIYNGTANEQVLKTDL